MGMGVLRKQCSTAGDTFTCSEDLTPVATIAVFVQRFHNGGIEGGRERQLNRKQEV
jgi:hypothetical protein